ncbi:MAG: F0F1 ATP synthase subunit A [Maricaulis sp.]|uniref:F0F1 ATP synthase subunit A n=1 Tax=Maricaulis sp. TaxID=1486257 RepID=UPI001B288BCB|nr:F0F1 ATP synthase subunit A [Maricaulis sp.]MBO6729405.1 F0F1 ATP synthase subunit A [Maricaulis sp.]MBO6847800.1 F0F1 ATP synthase subunit A [Maricaulis sp.]MBO6877345.1 F0F1 ATP synthase subunit A [Maricaulis sp.]
MADTNPIKQFEVHTVEFFGRELHFELFGYDLSFTNSSFFMVLTSVLTIVLFSTAMGRRATIPSRSQSVAEIIYGFVADMLRSTAGSDALRFFPFVFTLFIFILVANMLGMFPYFPAPGWHSFTITSHIIVTAALAMMVWLTVLVYGLFKNGPKFFKLFVPSGVPMYILPFVTLIEIISFISRPISHSVRLFANMLAGHILLKVFAGFIVMLAAPEALGALGYAVGVLPFAMTLALTALEFLVAFLQAYVFAILTCIYLSDALHPGH